MAIALLPSPAPSWAQRAYVISAPGVAAYDPAISSDGRTVVYRSISSSGLHVVHVDGSGLQILPWSQYYGKGLSADGRLLAFSTYSFLPPGKTDAEVWLLDLRDGTRRNLTPGSSGGYLPAISDDGSTVAFTGFDSNLYVIGADGTNLRQVSGGYYTSQGGPSLSADGSVVVFDALHPVGPDAPIFRVNSDGTGLTPLTMDPNVTYLRPRVSADGARVTFERYFYDLYVARTDGSGIDQLSAGERMGFSGEGHDYSDISGDGRIAAFESFGRVFVVRTDGTGPRQVGRGETLALSGRGDVVVFAGDAGGVTAIIAAGVPGVAPGELDKLSFADDARTLSWATSPAANSHNLYRGDLLDLRSGVFGACLSSGIVPSTAVDDDVPPFGHGYFYLVTGANGAGEGTTGPTGAGGARVPAVPCPPVDTDGDGVADAQDGCPLDSDSQQVDTDGDGLGDVCDNCAIAWNPDQRADVNGVADRCKCLTVYNPGAADSDGDALVDSCDNCSATYNPHQEFLIDPVVQVLSPNGTGPALQIGSTTTLTWSASDVCGGVGLVDIYLSRTGAAGPYETVALGLSNSGSYPWRVTGPATSGATAFLKVRARDPGGNSAVDQSDGGFRIRQ
jgi:hypothetical protein